MLVVAGAVCVPKKGGRYLVRMFRGAAWTRKGGNVGGWHC